ncbi:MAG: type III-A CRISPR-associated RAMP protein Csm3 [Anaerolineae bacterium]
MADVRLYGRLFVECRIEAKTGLHIGGAATGLEIGGLDNVVVRDPLTNEPYIPGSSLKGKMRSLSEKRHGLRQNQRIGQDVRIHTCDDEREYATCNVCHVFGVPGERPFASPTRLLVRDIPLDHAHESYAKLKEARTDYPFTEVKWEAAIDRVTSAATPRQMERVPAGAVFGPAQLVFSFYERKDVDRLGTLVEAMLLLEDDYLGGQGSRGSGRIAFQDLEVVLRSTDNYREREPLGKYASLGELAEALPDLQRKVRETLPFKEA